MKNPHAIIRLVIITAALIGLGAIAFKYLRNQNNDNVEIQTISRGKLGTSHTSTKNGSSSGITAQGGSSSSNSLKGTTPAGGTCTMSRSDECISPYYCIAPVSGSQFGKCGDSGGFENSKSSKA